jgi:predicted O-methyltransferase YrrM
VDDLSGLRFPPAVQAIYRESGARDFAMVSGPLTGILLRTLAAAKPGGRFLELGTGTGAATAWILDGMDPRSSFVTVETNADLLAIAEMHLGADPRITFVRDDAATFLPRVQGQEFDLIFADTWSGKYEGLELALNLLRHGGIYVIDDMDPQPTWPPGHEKKVAGLLSRLEADPTLRMTKVTWASGIVIAAKVGR